SSQMWQAILHDDRVVASSNKSQNRKFPTSVFYYLTGAAACMLIGFATYFFQQHGGTTDVREKMPAIASEKAITPGREQATLTLPNGKVVTLDKLKQEKIMEDGFSLRFEDGQIKIDGATDALLAATTTLQTPQGGEYQIRLPDGTSVWLNAGSSITYPLAFLADRREVSITGEVFFDIVKDQNKPFVVYVDETSISVLGTSFNVSGYPEDKHIRTPLIEGSVRMQKGTQVK